MDSVGNEKDPRRWETRRQLSEKLQVSISTLERWHRMQIGPKAYLVAGLRLLRYDSQEVDEWIQREGN